MREVLVTKKTPRPPKPRTIQPTAAIGGNKLVCAGDRRNLTSQRRSLWNGGSRVGGIDCGRTRSQV